MFAAAGCDDSWISPRWKATDAADINSAGSFEAQYCTQMAGKICNAPESRAATTTP